jgi:antitoxin component YwqK of YwqJK toxin-antitoxin module
MQEEYVHQYGMQVSKNDWANRGQCGQVVTTQKNGVVVKKNYKGGELHGEVTYTYPHSDAIEKTEQYENGELVKEVLHYRSGNPEREIVFQSPTAKTVTLWYEEGSPQRIEEFEEDLIIVGQYFNKQNQVESRIDNGEGTRMNRDRWGNLISSDAFKTGQMINRLVYHPNGTPKESMSYLSGKLHGAKKSYLPGGEPQRVEHYVEDVKEGLTIVYENGEKCQEIPYCNGRKNGIERHFRNGDEVVEEISWKDDKKDGPSATYVAGVRSVDWYMDGRRVTKGQYDKFKRVTVVK